MSTMELPGTGVPFFNNGSDRTLVVNGLNGLDDFAAAMDWVKNVATAAARQPAKAQAAIQSKLKVAQAGAKEAIKLAKTAATSAPVTPKDVLSATGISRIIDAGKRAQVAVRFHNANAVKHEKTIADLTKRAEKVTDPKLRARLETDAAIFARELLAERTNAQRAALVAGATTTAVQFANKAKGKPEAERRNLLGQAAAAIDAGKQVAVTKVAVKLPEVLTDNAIRAKAAAAGIPVKMKPPTNTGVAPPMPNVPFLKSSGGATAPGLPMGFPAGTPFAAAFAKANPVHTADLSGLDGLNGLDGIFDSIINVAKSIIPPHTIVGKALNGNIGGAVASTVQLVAGAAKGGSAPAPAPAPAPLPPPEPLPTPLQQVQTAIVSNAQAITNGLPGWVLPVGGLTVAGVIAAALLL